MTSNQSVTMPTKIERKSERLSLHFSSVTWLVLVSLVAIGAITLRHDVLLVVSAAFVMAIPAVLDIVLGDEESGRDGKDVWIVFGWIALALLAIWAAGGVMSPLSILLVLAPLHAFSRQRFRLGIEASVFAAFGFLGVAVLDAMGYTSGNANWLGPLASLGALISVLQTAVFIWASWRHFLTYQSDQQLVTEWRRVLEDSEVYVLGLNASGTLMRAAGDRAFLQLPPDLELKGHAISDVFDGCEQIKSVDGGSVLLTALWTQDQDFEARLTKARDGFRLVLSPVSEAFLASETLKSLADEQAVQLADQSRWLASIGHEMKNMLNPIGGYVDLIASEQLGPLDPAYKSFVGTIKQGTEHLNMLVDDMMIATKSGTDHLNLFPEPLDIRQEIEDTIKLMGWMSDAHAVSVLLSDGADHSVIADRKAVRQILVNLLSNAIKYSEARGRVSVSVTKDQYGVRIDIKDEGEGIDEDDLKRLGEPFYQGQNAKNKPGTGLGLSIVKLLTANMNGHFGLDSKKGRGTRAFVWLPPNTNPPQQSLKDRQSSVKEAEVS